MKRSLTLVAALGLLLMSTIPASAAGPNHPPDAVDDVVPNAFDTDPAFDWGWLANDSDPDGDPFLVTAVTQPDSFGTVTIVGGGTGIEYDSNEDSGTDTFTYTITDSHGASDTATATVHVTDLFIDYAALCIPTVLSKSSGLPGTTFKVQGTTSRGPVEVVLLWDDTIELATGMSGVGGQFEGHGGFYSIDNVTIPANATPGNHVIRTRERGNAAQPYVGCPNATATFEVTAAATPAPVVTPPPTDAFSGSKDDAGRTLPLLLIVLGILGLGALVVSPGRVKRR